MAKYDGKVIINTELNNSGISKGVKEIKGSLDGLKNVVSGLGGAIARAFSVAAIVRFATESVKAANKLSDALTGLKSILDGQGRSFSGAQKFLEEYTADGLIPMANAITAYKNLTSRGYNDSQIRKTLVALKDASAFGRQASYSMGQAVESATEGLKNENSVLVDNAGVTKNVAKMWEEYAASIGTTASNLTQQQKIQAEVNGILTESRFQAGDAAKVANTLSGQLSQLSVNFNNLKVAVGNALRPFVQSFLPVINVAIAALTRFAKAVASVVGALFGSTTSGTVEATQQVADGYNSAAEGAENLANSTEKAGKAAKKYLAGFDELTKIGDASGENGTGVGLDMSAGTATSYTSSTGIDSSKIEEMAGLLGEIDLTHLKKPVVDLQGAFRGLIGVIGDVFSWVWQEIFVPLAGWFVEEAAPASIEALSSAFNGLASTVSVIFDAIQSCWDELRPVFQWVGETVLVVLADFKEIGEGVARKWEENRDKLKKTFKNIGVVIQKVWVVIGPVLTWLRNAISEIAVNLPLDDLQLFFDRLFAISEILAGIFTGDIKQIFNGFGAAIGAETEYAASQIKTFASAVGIDLAAVDRWVKQAADNIGLCFSGSWEKIVETWEGAAAWFKDTVIAPLKEFWSPIGEWFGELFGDIEQALSDVFYNIGVIAEGCWELIKTAWDAASGWFDEKIIQPLKKKFEDAWCKVSGLATETWEEIKETVRPWIEWLDEKLIGPLKEKFSELWSGFKENAAEAWDEVKGAFSGIAQWAKGMLNELIGALNSGMSKIFSGINSGLSKLRDLKVGDIQPFSSIRTLTVPRIPYLAKGAVLPANKPFLAMVGDQRHGTNIEAPLTTIQEALALVMEDYAAANLAGQEAVIAVLKEILEAILGIEISDTVIGQAVQRYSARMAVVRGG